MDEADIRWYLFSEGQSYGPYTQEQLHKFVLGGQASGDTRVCVVGSQEWVLLAQAFPQFFEGAPPPHAPRVDGPRRAGRRPHIVSDVRLQMASTRSYVGTAVLTLFLYWIGFWIIGLVANLVFLGQARQDERMLGVAPPGKGCLVALLWVFAWIPIIGFFLYFGLSAVKPSSHVF